MGLEFGNDETVWFWLWVHYGGAVRLWLQLEQMGALELLGTRWASLTLHVASGLLHMVPPHG